MPTLVYSADFLKNHHRDLSLEKKLGKTRDVGGGESLGETATHTNADFLTFHTRSQTFHAYRVEGGQSQQEGESELGS